MLGVGMGIGETLARSERYCFWFCFGIVRTGGDGDCGETQSQKSVIKKYNNSIATLDERIHDSFRSQLQKAIKTHLSLECESQRRIRALILVLNCCSRYKSLLMLSWLPISKSLPGLLHICSCIKFLIGSIRILLDEKASWRLKLMNLIDYDFCLHASLVFGYSVVSGFHCLDKPVIMLITRALLDGVSFAEYDVVVLGGCHV